MVAVPEKIGKYRIESLVAKGGMGAVYKGIHPELKRPVIIKKLSIRGNAAVSERFKREAKILLDLNNPHIVHMYDYFHEAGSRYIVLEYVDGMSLDVLLRRKRVFSGEMALLVILEVCMALKYAHDRGIIHRDIKPGNILISRKGEIKLADFGIASSDSDAADVVSVEDPSASGGKSGAGKAVAEKDLTVAGTMLGTPSYMPPEQFADSSTVDKRADIYAVGVMLYEMVTGTKPYSGNGLEGTQAAIRKGKYTSIRKISPGVPSLVVRLVRKMIRVNPKRRFQDMAPVIKTVRKFLSRYPVRDIRYTLVENMLTTKMEEGVFQKKKRTGLTVALVLVSALTLGFAAITAWEYGYVHRYLLRPWFAPVTIRMELPALAKDSVYDSSDLQFRAFFFTDDGKEIPEVTGTRRLLSPKEETGASRFLLEGRAVWLRPGDYRAKLVAGPRIWWYTFRVAKADLVIEPDFGGASARSLSVRMRAFDAVTGKNISSLAKLTVLVDNRWISLTEIDTSRLRTGTIQKFRAVAPGYGEREFSLKIGWYQDELLLDAGLIPEKK